MKSHLKLGTRRSLLAWAQSSWVARELERLNPGIKVELVGIDTRGDKIQDVPLQSVQGKEFFVAELDQALRSREVDLSVHSMKDLSLDRPKDFALAAVPARANPRDVVLFGPQVIEKLRRGQPIRIGTSSPRRIENIPSFLARALPRFGSEAPKLEFVEIRGNVNTRLSRVIEALESPRALDGAVLAFAGLIRLWADAAGRAELSKLLKDVRWMVLPLVECPAASAQGALAVECRADDREVRDIIRKLHHEPTARAAQRERALLAEWGGGCHQRFGATAIHHPELGELMYVRGKKPDNSAVDGVSWQAPSKPGQSVQAWDGMEWRPSESASPAQALPSVSGIEGQAVFVAHSRALPDSWLESARKSRIWTSGTSSWFRLAEKGLWVEGSADGLGYDFLQSTLREEVLQLPEASRWKVLTHEDARSGWKSEQVVATYRVPLLTGDTLERAKAALKRATHVFWASGSQYEALRGHAPARASHACGAGKTAQQLRDLDATLNLTVFPSNEEWKKWLNA